MLKLLNEVLRFDLPEAEAGLDAGNPDSDTKPEVSSCTSMRPQIVHCGKRDVVWTSAWDQGSKLMLLRNQVVWNSALCSRNRELTLHPRAYPYANPNPILLRLVGKSR